MTSMQIPSAGGLLQMLKEGTMYMDDADDHLMNISTCANMTKSFASSFGPNGMNKLIINHLEKISITNDAAAIMNQMELQNPAAKILMYASQIQEEEVGDGTNFVLVFAGALLENAKELIKSGLATADIVEGYNMAKKKALEILPGMTCDSVKNFEDEKEMIKYLKSCIMSKQYGNEDVLVPLIVKACIMAKSKEKDSFNVDNIRVCKILGSAITQSYILRGMCFKIKVESEITSVQNAKIGLYSCAIDQGQTETKGTVLLKSADQLLNYTKGEENLLEQKFRAIASSGCNVIVSGGGKVGDLASHFANKYKIMVIRLQSKFDLRRVAKMTGAGVIPTLAAPSSEQLGHCDKVYIDEIGETNVIIFDQENKDVSLVTIILRGSSDNVMDDIERVIDDGVNNYKALTRDPRVLPGAGATEIQLALEISDYADTCPGLQQYAIKKYGESFLSIPKALAENAGVKAMELISLLNAEHQKGNKTFGFEIESIGTPMIKDAHKYEILDPLIVKEWAIKYATQASNTILSIDKIIMSKPAGGPAPREPKTQDGDED
ncbi:unnamed protein product [Gordionus sp. m RMFG-2023]|uniref:T-complex protein 1 subunit theta-like n=1 Tax=Gordionus sp. m RMFG-2023 TaxID=3053472 RepID=UPI0030E45091